MYGKRADTLEFRRNRTESEIFLRKSVQIAEMLNDEDTGLQQNGVNWPAASNRVIDIVGVYSNKGSAVVP